MDGDMMMTPSDIATQAATLIGGGRAETHGDFRKNKESRQHRVHVECLFAG
jgi:hypothetical protein